MKKQIITLLAASCLLSGSMQAQQVSTFTPEQQAKIEAIKQEEMKGGIPEDVAQRRAETIVKGRSAASLRSTATPLRTLTPPSVNSIWVDRDTAAVPGPYHPYHAYDKDSLVMNVFLADPKAKSAITNVTFDGEWTATARSLAYFSNGDDMGISSGLILATGDVLGGPTITANPEGPNDDIGSFSSPSTFMNLHGDPHLTPLINLAVAPQGIRNGSCLEFDFKPFANKATFDFIFASEEYPNFSNSSYNDVFGFFVWEVPNAGAPGDTINIAYFPDGTTPVAINNSNWGWRGNNTPADFQAPTEVKTSGYASVNMNAVNPQWHVPVYLNDPLMEFDGHTIKLTAVAANLDTTKTYHLKLAIANTQDTNLGSAVFLANLDLGTPNGNMSGEMDPEGGLGWNSVWDDEALARNDFYCGCNNQLKFDIEPKPRDRYLHFEFSPDIRPYTIVGDSIFPDSVFVTSNRNAPVIINFSTEDLPEDIAGSPINVYSYFTNASGPSPTPDLDTTTFTLYNHPTYDIKYIAPSAVYPGKLDLNVKGGTPYLRVSIDGGLHWQLASQAFTGGQLQNLEEDFKVWFKEPNSCWSVVAHVNTGEVFPGVTRPILISDINNATLNVPTGIHYVNSGSNYTFTITPTGENAGKRPVVTTGRTTPPDNVGVVVKDNGDGTFTVTIREVKSPIELGISFTSNPDANMDVDGTNIYSSHGTIYIAAATAGTANIYQMSGYLYKTVTFAAGETSSVSAPAGVYVITLSNGKSYKIAVQ